MLNEAVPLPHTVSLVIETEAVGLSITSIITSTGKLSQFVSPPEVPISVINNENCPNVFGSKS